MTRLPHAYLGSRRLRISLLSGLVLLQALLAISQAAVTSAITGDGTLGTTVTRSGTIHTIAGGTRPGNGPNLFHSFDRFSVGTGDTARFSSPTGIANIMSRVTGGQPSAIDGRLQSTIQGANLYLLNPSGVLFGPNATLDVRGSFHVSTADFLRLADGVKFFAHLGQESRLTVAEPAAFGFLGSTPAPITMQGSGLRVPTGRALSVVGGDLTLAGGILRAASGRIQLASVASPGEVIFRPLELAPDLQVEGFARLGRLEFLQGALADVSGVGVEGSGGPGGTVLIWSGRLLVDRSFIWAFTLGAADGARLGIDLRVTESVDLAGQGTLSGLASATLGNGRAGDIYVKAGRITVTGGAQILGTTAGGGQGGNLTVIAEDALVLSGASSDGVFPSALATNALNKGPAGRLFVSAPTVTMEGGIIQALTVGDGDAGEITLEVGSLRLTGGAQVVSSSGATNLGTGQLQVGRGRGGDLTITATEGITIAGRDNEGFPSGFFTDTSGSGAAGRMFISTPRLHMQDGRITSATEGDGRAGDLTIKVGGLTLDGGAQIASGSGVRTRSGVRAGKGQGGNLTITAEESVSISGRDGRGVPSGIFANTFGSGNAGNISIFSPSLIMDAALIQATTEGSSGNAGSIEVRAGRVTLTGSAQIDSRTDGAGRGGNVTVAATEQIELSSGGTISASSSGQGDAGNIVIWAGQLFRSRNGAVTTEAARAGGGTIALHAGRLVQLQDSEVTTSVRGGEADAGNLTLDAPFVVADGSAIVANAFGGRGGNILINAGVFLADPASLVSASSTLGVHGTVNIQAPVTSLSGTLAPLPQTVVSAAALLPARCAARLSGGKYSSLVLSGRGGLPLEPSGVLPSPLVLEERLAADPAVIGARHQQPSSARFALLASQDKALPRLGCPP